MAFRLADDPTLLVGGSRANPDEELNPKQGYLRAAQLSDGRLVVIDVDKVTVYSDAGVLERTIGRNGAGPQEFRYLTAVCVTRGDTVVVNDNHNGRIAIVDPNAGLIVRMLPTGRTWLFPQGCLADGTFVVGRSVTDTATDEPGYSLVRIRLNGDTVGTLGMATAPPASLLMGGAVSVAVMGERVHVARPQFSEIRSFDASGHLLRVLRVRDPVREVTGTDAEAYGPQLAAGQPKQSAPRTSDLGTAARMPFFQQINVDPDGRLWMQDYLAPGYTADVWTGFDTDGTLLGKFTIARAEPGSVNEVIGFTRGGVILRGNDDQGAATVGVYPLVRQP